MDCDKLKVSNKITGRDDYILQNNIILNIFVIYVRCQAESVAVRREQLVQRAQCAGARRAPPGGAGSAAARLLARRAI